MDNFLYFFGKNRANTAPDMSRKAGMGILIILTVSI